MKKLFLAINIVFMTLIACGIACYFVFPIEIIKILTTLSVLLIAALNLVNVFYQKSNDKKFIIATEIGVKERLERDYPDKEFFLISPKAVCPNMKWHKLEDILNCLINEEHEISVDESIAQKALQPIEKMIKIKG